MQLLLSLFDVFGFLIDVFVFAAVVVNFSLSNCDDNYST